MSHARFNRLDNCNYSLSEDGRILVEDNATGITGLFDEFGAYIQGELKQADVQMCQFLAKLGKHRPGG